MQALDELSLPERAGGARGPQGDARRGDGGAAAFYGGGARGAGGGAAGAAAGRDAGALSPAREKALSPGEIVDLLDKIRKTGAHGVVLKAPDLPEVAAAVARLVAAGIAVVTLVTDIPRAPRCAYVGMDNRAAGETAAYLIGRWVGAKRGR